MGDDELIQLAANSLVRCVSDKGTVAHIGTNEFAVSLPGFDAAQAEAVAAEIQTAFEKGNSLGPEQDGELLIKGPQVMLGYLVSTKGIVTVVICPTPTDDQFCIPTRMTQTRRQNA